MRLATIRLADDRTAAARIDPGRATELGYGDVGELLRKPGWADSLVGAEGPQHALGEVAYAPLICRPNKLICVGLNYRMHSQETGQALPSFPTLFAKYPEALIGANDTIVLPSVSRRVDWEAELAVVIGSPVRRATLDDASRAIAGYAVLNDVSARDWQRRTTQWLQGKTFEATCPFGPWLVTPDDCNDGQGLAISCEVDGIVVQAADTSEMVFKPAALVSYVSTVLTLVPGDVIATGTPAGIGDSMLPPQYLREGSTVVTRIAGLGECRNVCRREAGSNERNSGMEPVREEMAAGEAT